MEHNKCNDVDFEKTFRFSLTALRINGAHPSVQRDKKWLLKFIITHGIFTTVFIIMIFNVYLDIKQKNFSVACQDGTVSIIYCVISFQYYILFAHQTTIARIIDIMKADFTKDMSEDAREIVYVYSRKGRKVCLHWLLIVIVTAIVFFTKHIFLELYSYAVDDWKLIEMYPLTYPSLVEEHKDNLFVFAVIYFALVYYILYASVMYLGFVPLGPMFMTHACGQLEIVKKEILALYEDNSAEEIKIKVNDIVKHLQVIYR